MSIKFTCAGKTDVGLVRPGNEDNYKILEEQNLFVVCDGMGGHQAGEVASGMACDIVSYCFTGIADSINADDQLGLPGKFPPMSDILIKSIRLASRAIFSRADANPDQSGMGTTVVAAVIEGNMVGIAHVGDSRVYKLVGSKLIPMTTDHSWVTELQKSGLYEEMKNSGQVNKNVITRAMGVHDVVEIDFRLDPVNVGDIFILCSDGLCGYAEDEIISELAASCNGNVGKIVDVLVKLANDRGGQDNVTVAAFRIDEISGEPEHEAIAPVTIGEESETVLHRQDELINSINYIQNPAETEYRNNGQKSSNMPLILIVSAIAIIVLLIVYAVLK